MVSSKSLINFSSYLVSEHANAKRWQTQCSFKLDSSTLQNLGATPFSQPIITDAPSDKKALRSARSSCNWFCIRFFKLSNIYFPLALVSSSPESMSAVCRNFVSGSLHWMLWYFTNVSSCCMLEISVASSESKTYIPVFFSFLISFSFSKPDSIMTISQKICEECISNNSRSLTPTDSNKMRINVNFTAAISAFASQYTVWKIFS